MIDNTHWETNIVFKPELIDGFVYQFYFPTINKYYIGAKKVNCISDRKWEYYNTSSNVVHQLLADGLTPERTILSTHETWEETLEVETKLLVEAKAGINDKYLNLVTSFDTPELNSFIPRVSKRARTPSTRQKDLEARCSELFFDNRDLRDEIIELKKQLADVTHSQPSYDVYRAKYDPKRVV